MTEEKNSGYSENPTAWFESWLYNYHDRFAELLVVQWVYGSSHSLYAIWWDELDEMYLTIRYFYAHSDFYALNITHFREHLMRRLGSIDEARDFILQYGTQTYNNFIFFNYFDLVDFEVFCNYWNSLVAAIEDNLFEESREITLSDIAVSEVIDAEMPSMHRSIVISKCQKRGTDFFNLFSTVYRSRDVSRFHVFASSMQEIYEEVCELRTQPAFRKLNSSQRHRWFYNKHSEFHDRDIVDLYELFVDYLESSHDVLSSLVKTFEGVYGFDFEEDHA